jgi:hypothetical protein
MKPYGSFTPLAELIVTRSVEPIFFSLRWYFAASGSLSASAFSTLPSEAHLQAKQKDVRRVDVSGFIEVDP